MSDKAECERLETEYEERTDAIWAETRHLEYKDIPQSQIEEIRAKCDAVAEELGMGKHGTLPLHLNRDPETPESTINPEHLFKIGYFRSSYNAGGINSVVRQMTGKEGLNWVFEKEDNEYTFQPNWTRAANRAQMLIAEMKAKTEDQGGHMFVIESSVNPFVDPADVEHMCSSKEDALKLYRQEYSRQAEIHEDARKSGYSNISGHWFIGKPLEAVGVVMGIEKHWLGTKQVVTYVICKGTDEVLESYLDSLRIVIETCEWVIAQPTPENYWLRWSA
jgi:hypothetical protein